MKQINEDLVKKITDTKKTIDWLVVAFIIALSSMFLFQNLMYGVLGICILVLIGSLNTSRKLNKLTLEWRD